MPRMNSEGIHLCFCLHCTKIVDSIDPVNRSFFAASLLNSSKAKAACPLTTVEVKATWQ